MKQPTKDTLREQLALAADEIIRLREEIQKQPIGFFFSPPGSHHGWMIGSAVGGHVTNPWWRRVLTPQQHAARQRGWEAHSAAAQVLTRMQAPRKWWHRLWDKCKAVLGRG